MEQRTEQFGYDTWTSLLVGAVGIVVLCGGWFGSSSQESDLARAAGSASQRQRALPDLVPVTDASHASLDGLALGSQEAQDRQRRAVQELGLPLEVRTRKVGIPFRLIPAGSFKMPDSHEPANEEKSRLVTLTKPFYCGKYEVTQKQWEQVMGSNPSYFTDVPGNAPVENVSWNECQAFLKKLCQIEEVNDGEYRLLTDVDWEYACRAGTQTAFCYGDSLDPNMANYGNTARSVPRSTMSGEMPKYRGATLRVGSFRPNAWGLYDMHGNVAEWCQDSYQKGPGAELALKLLDPEGRAPRPLCVRGGGWYSDARACGSAWSFGWSPNSRMPDLGLRLVRIISSSSNRIGMDNAPKQRG